MRYSALHNALPCTFTEAEKCSGEGGVMGVQDFKPLVSATKRCWASQGRSKPFLCRCQTSMESTKGADRA